MVRRKKISQARFNNLLSQLRKKGDMRFRRTKVREVFFVELDFFRRGIT